MYKKIIKYTIIIFAVIVLLIYSESILGVGKKLRYKQQGYIVCDDFVCMNKNMQTCNKAYRNVNSGFKWIDIFVQGFKDNKCIYEVKRYTNNGYICSFDGEVFSKKLVDEVFGVHNGLRDTIINNCKHINY